MFCRVLRPPGGGSSNIFGADESPKPAGGSDTGEAASETPHEQAQSLKKANQAGSDIFGSGPAEEAKKPAKGNIA